LQGFYFERDTYYLDIPDIEAASTLSRHRESALVAEQQRIVETSRTELSRVEAQLTATRKMLESLNDRTQAALVDRLFQTLNNSGVRITFAD